MIKYGLRSKHISLAANSATLIAAADKDRVYLQFQTEGPGGSFFIGDSSVGSSVTSTNAWHNPANPTVFSGLEAQAEMYILNDVTSCSVFVREIVAGCA